MQRGGGRDCASLVLEFTLCTSTNIAARISRLTITKVHCPNLDNRPVQNPKTPIRVLPAVNTNPIAKPFAKNAGEDGTIFAMDFDAAAN